MTVKRIFTLFVLSILSLACFATAFACDKGKERTEATATVLAFELNDDEQSYKVIGFIEDLEEIPTEIEIPAEYAGKPVTAIGARSFQNCANVTKVVISEGVKTIGASAFYGCKALKDLSIPESVESFGSMAFYNCKKITSITIPDTMDTIPSALFFGCESLTEMTIPSSVKRIQSNAFGESGVKELVLPDSVTDLEEGAFKNATALEEVVMGSGIVTLGAGLFDGCTSLSSVTIGSGVKAIYEYAFSGCESLQSIVVPAGVRAIYKGAFEGCINLKHMDFEGVNDSNFWECSSATCGINICPASENLGFETHYHSSFWNTSENAGSAYKHYHSIFSHDLRDPEEAWKYFVGFEYGGSAYTMHDYPFGASGWKYEDGEYLYRVSNNPETWSGEPLKFSDKYYLPEQIISMWSWNDSTDFYWYNGTKGEW